MLDNLGIGKKLNFGLLGFVVIISLMMIYFFTQYYFTAETYRTEVVHENEIVEHTLELKINVLEIRKNEKDFYKTKDTLYSNEVHKTIKSTNQLLKDLSIHIQSETKKDTISILSNLIQKYQTEFESFEKNIKLRGYSHNDGLQGTFRSAAHACDGQLKAQNNNALLVEYLRLRKHEKDYMLRDDKKYVKKAQKVVGKLSQFPALTQLMNNYMDAFNKLVEADDKISSNLNNIENYTNEIFNISKSLEENALKESQLLNESASEQVDFNLILLFSISIVVLSILLFFSRKISKDINKEIDNTNYKINDIISQVIDGQLDTRANNEDVGVDFKELVTNINKLIDAFTTPLNLIAEYIDRISKGSLPPKITEEYKGDFNEIKANLNMCIDSIQSLTDESIEVSENILLGQYKFRSDHSTKQGAYKDVLKGFNRAIDSLESIVDVANGIAVINMDLDSQIIYANQFALEINKTDRDSIHGKTVQSVFGNKLDQVLNNPSSLVELEIELHGVEYSFTALVEPLIKNNETVGHKITLIDQTVVKKAMKKAELASKESEAALVRNNKISEYQINESKKLSESLHKLSNGLLNFNIKVDDYDEDTKESAQMFEGIYSAVSDTATTINKLINEVEQLAVKSSQGDLEARADDNQFKGAYKDMVTSVNYLLDQILNPIEETVKVLKEMAEGNLSIKVVGDYQGDHAILKNAINQTVDLMPFTEAMKVLEAMADGDLTNRMHGDYKGDSLKMKNALNATVDSMKEMIHQVIVTVDEVSKGSIQVANASNNLSQGALTQAASLEEISSSMGEIGSKAKSNAENASIANNLTHGAKDSSEKGNVEMHELINAMNEIKESSANINKIIKVIDEIAFQTNLLALNAAVEAARAGRHGKGFAVVAEEVRNLAARSATAAQETSELIEKSISSVEGGVSLVERTSTALQEIKNGTTKSSDIVGDISRLSNEQAQAISQINESLQQIDRVTQSNTANAEESASASEELSSQAKFLETMLSRFNIGDDFSNQSFKLEGTSQKTKALPSADGFEQDDFDDMDFQHDPSETINLDDDEFGKY